MHFMVTLARSRTLMAGWLRDLLNAHRRKVEQEEHFYRSLATYCRANNVSPVCEDDWKTTAYIRNDDKPSTIHRQGDVLWTKANLPR
jgi:hypothetical protein